MAQHSKKFFSLEYSKNNKKNITVSTADNNVGTRIMIEVQTTLRIKKRLNPKILIMLIGVTVFPWALEKSIFCEGQFYALILVNKPLHLFFLLRSWTNDVQYVLCFLTYWYCTIINVCFINNILTNDYPFIAIFCYDYPIIVQLF